MPGPPLKRITCLSRGLYFYFQVIRLDFRTSTLNFESVYVYKYTSPANGSTELENKGNYPCWKDLTLENFVRIPINLQSNYLPSSSSIASRFGQVPLTSLWLSCRSPPSSSPSPSPSPSTGSYPPLRRRHCAPTLTSSSLPLMGRTHAPPTRPYHGRRSRRRSS